MIYFFEYQILLYDEVNERTERKYGITAGEDAGTALSTLGLYYGEEIMQVEYFGEVDTEGVYEFNETFANNPKVTGRHFGKIVPKINPSAWREEDKIYE